jgi:hypothetical protein
MMRLRNTDLKTLQMMIWRNGPKMSTVLTLQMMRFSTQAVHKNELSTGTHTVNDEAFDTRLAKK